MTSSLAASHAQCPEKRPLIQAPTSDIPMAASPGPDDFADTELLVLRSSSLSGSMWPTFIFPVAGGVTFYACYMKKIPVVSLFFCLFINQHLLQLGVSLTTVRGVPMILSCSVSLETDWHVSFLENFRSHPAHGNQRFEITMGREVKNKVF